MARPEQTEKATPKRRSEARTKGQVARSADLSSAVTFLSTSFVLHTIVLSLIKHFGEGLRWAIQHAAYHPTLSTNAALSPYIGWVGAAFLPVGFVFACSMVVGIGINLAQVGFHVSLKPLAPNFSRLNPLSGFKRLFFSPQTIVNLLKQVLKITLVGSLFYAALKDSIVELFALSEASPFAVVTTVEGLIFALSMRFGFFLLFIGLVDYFWERHQLESSLKMTKTEVRDENKQQEGSREAKGVFRRRQRELSRRMMMAAVPKATVVVTNPTHFAVALLWDEEKMDAPIVVAKGADLLAKRVRDLARQHHIPIVENPPLARALYRDVPIESAVPVELYATVAKVIAFVYALKARPSSGSLIRR